MTQNNDSELSRNERFGIFIVSVSGFVALLVFITDVSIERGVNDFWAWSIGISISLISSIIIYVITLVLAKKVVQKRQQKKSKVTFWIWTALAVLFVLTVIYSLMNFNKVIENLDEDTHQEQSTNPDKDGDTITPKIPEPIPVVLPPEIDPSSGSGDDPDKTKTKEEQELEDVLNMSYD